MLHASPLFTPTIINNITLKKELNIENWKRADHYHFFKNYDNPFYNICTEVEVTELYNYCKKYDLSFFLTSLYFSIKAANSVKELKLRIEEDKVFEYDFLHPFSTVLNDDYTFSFCDFVYTDDLNLFCSEGKELMAKITSEKGLKTKSFRHDVIHYTTIPWIKINGMTHARSFNTNDSIPKIVFGKYFKENEKLMLPTCIEVHHSLVDGYHLGLFFENFRTLIKELVK